MFDAFGVDRSSRTARFRSARQRVLLRALRSAFLGGLIALSFGRPARIAVWIRPRSGR